MISFIMASFKWLPTPLYIIVSAIFTFFCIFVGVVLIKVIWNLISFVVNILAGVLGKVVALFV